MKRCLPGLITLLILFSLNQGFGQSTTDEPEIWYVWIDTEVSINSETVRLVSEEPIEISCCVKSPKYRRFVKGAGNWIRKNVSKEYDGITPLKKLQDIELAREMISEAKTSGKVQLVAFTAGCK